MARINEGSARRVSLLAALLFAAMPPAGAAPPLSGEQLPAAFLAECDARAEPYARYPAPLAAAAKTLIDIGAFAGEEFADARIGSCALRGAGGPVATTACSSGVILLDEKYARAGETLPLRATLAHEMKHHLQHVERKVRRGDGYCDSALYAEEKPALEAEADAFGDRVAELFVLGREVEIVNACDDALLIYLEADDPVAVRGAAPAFQRLPARSSALSIERGLSNRFRFHAQTIAAEGPPRIWQDAASAQTRIVDGKRLRLKETRLSASDRVESPFRLVLSCAAGETGD